MSSAAEFEASLKAGFTTVRGAENAALSISSAGGDFTGSYTQEKNVDEFDAVRYDGSRLFVAPRRYLPCCYLAAGAPGNGAADGGPTDEASIRILSTDPASGSANLESSISLEDGVSVLGMYLHEGRMLALTSALIYGGYGHFWAGIVIWAPEQLGCRVYDVSDPASPSLVVDVSIDGVFVDSRRVGDVVYIVSRCTPTVEGLVHNVTTAADQAQNQALLANVPLDALLPKVTVDGVSRTLVDPGRCYVGTDAFGTSDFVDHRLYVLRESPTLPELHVVAELPNAQRPEERADYGERAVLSPYHGGAEPVRKRRNTSVVRAGAPDLRGGTRAS